MASAHGHRHLLLLLERDVRWARRRRPPDGDPGAAGPCPPPPSQAQLDPGNYSFQVSYGGDSNYKAASIPCEPFAVAKADASPPVITNVPSGAIFGGSFVAAVTHERRRHKVGHLQFHRRLHRRRRGFTVTYVGAGTCSLTAHVSGTANYGAQHRPPQTFSRRAGHSLEPRRDEHPRGRRGVRRLHRQRGDERGRHEVVTSNSTDVCTVGPDGLSVTYRAASAPAR